MRRFSPGASPPVGVAAAERRSPEQGAPPKALWKHDVVSVNVPQGKPNAIIIELGGGADAAGSSAGVTVTNKNTVTTLTTVTPQAGALVTAPPALATGGAKAGVPAVNAGLNATTTGNVLGVGKAGTGTGAAVKAPTTLPGALPVTAGAAHVVGTTYGGLAGSAAMLFLAGAAGTLIMA